MENVFCFMCDKICGWSKGGEHRFIFCNECYEMYKDKEQSIGHQIINQFRWHGFIPPEPNKGEIE